MADDIVTQLREHPVELLRCDCVRCVAADEIERLRAEIKRLTAEVKVQRIAHDMWFKRAYELEEMLEARRD